MVLAVAAGTPISGTDHRDVVDWVQNSKEAKVR